MALYGIWNKFKLLTVAIRTLPDSASAHYLQPHCSLLTSLQSQGYLLVLSVNAPSSFPSQAFTHAAPSTGNSLLSILSLAGSLSFITSQITYTTSSDVLWVHNLKLAFLLFFLALLFKPVITISNYIFSVYLCYVCLALKCGPHEGREHIYFAHHWIPLS